MRAPCSGVGLPSPRAARTERPTSDRPPARGSAAARSRGFRAGRAGSMRSLAAVASAARACAMRPSTIPGRLSQLFWRRAVYRQAIRGFDDTLVFQTSRRRGRETCPTDFALRESFQGSAHEGETIVLTVACTGRLSSTGMIVEPATPEKMGAAVVAEDDTARDFRGREAMDPASFGTSRPGPIPQAEPEASRATPRTRPPCGSPRCQARSGS
ncbi:hypothetical protein BDD21_0295 [Thiocapsa rosea]|uniref:Uncharacterized protein n=1 Tax=Thiocapsa rosea TaxID=69360 RepID=A0A495V2T9_9GAMM|nr:hypothetical protein BDD21_0295 [Thiocapsa rosea]